MTSSNTGRGERGPVPIGTAREIADSNLKRFRESLARAKAGGPGNVKVIERKLNDWLEYRHRHQEDGTLDDERRL